MTPNPGDPPVNPEPDHPEANHAASADLFWDRLINRCLLAAGLFIVVLVLFAVSFTWWMQRPIIVAQATSPDGRYQCVVYELNPFPAQSPYQYDVTVLDARTGKRLPGKSPFSSHDSCVVRDWAILAERDQFFVTKTNDEAFSDDTRYGQPVFIDKGQQRWETQPIPLWKWKLQTSTQPF